MAPASSMPPVCPERKRIEPEGRKLGAFRFDGWHNGAKKNGWKSGLEIRRGSVVVQ